MRLNQTDKMEEPVAIRELEQLGNVHKCVFRVDLFC